MTIYNAIITYILINFIFSLKLEITKIEYTPERPEVEYYYKELFTNRMAVNISIGEPIQNISLLLRTTLEVFYIISKNASSEIVRNYDENKSTTKKINYDIYSMVLKEYSTGYRAQEHFIIDNKKIISDFVFTKSVFKEATKLDGCLGLGMLSSKFNETTQVNFIKYLKTNNYINSYDFRLDIVDDNRGYLLIDEQLGDDYELKSIASTDIYKIVKHGIDLDYSIIGNTSIGVSKLLIDLDETYFTLYYLSTDPLYKMFLKFQQLGICNSKILNETNYRVCSSEIFKYDLSLKMYNKILNYTFEFSTKEMFKEVSGGLYIFLIRSTTDMLPNTVFKVGSYFLKKYKMSFNQDKKKIGIIVKKQNIDKNSNIIPIILIILCVLVIVTFTIVVYKTIKNKTNKRKNKFDDEYDYNAVEQ